MMKQLLAIVFLSFPLFSHAESDVANRFRNAALNAVARSESLGIQEVDGIKMSSIKKVAKEVIISYNPNITMVTGNRRCARWQPEAMAKTVRDGELVEVKVAAGIFLNNDCVKLPDQELEGIAIHEVLGVGFDKDRNYEISTQIMTGITRSKVSPLLNRDIVNELHRKTTVERYSGGGATGVGGGGDFDDLKLKMAGLTYLNTYYANVDYVFGVPKDVFMEALLRMNVSPAADIQTDIEFRAAGVERGPATIYIRKIGRAHV